MNVNLSNSLYTRTNNFVSRKGILSENGGTFFDTVTTALGKAKNDQYVRNVSSAITKSKLEDEDYKYLSSNWNPQNMTQKEYDEFLDFLQSKGIISEEDKKYVCYGGERLDRGEPESWYSPLEPVHDFADGNVLAFVRYQSSLIYDHKTTETKREVDLYKKITSIMEEMVKRTGDN